MLPFLITHQLSLLALATLCLPLGAFLLMGLWALLAKPLTEASTARLVLPALGSSALAAALLALRWWQHPIPVELPLGHWFSTGEYRFEVVLYLDALSTGFLLTSAVLTFVVARFAVDYLHREAGFFRFFVLMCLFSSGMNTLIAAGNLDFLFAGWELVGLTSVLLVAFYGERLAARRASLRVLITYRACDLGMLVTATMLHGWHQSQRFHDWNAAGFDVSKLPPSAVFFVLFGVLVAAMGKSALFPFGAWLPRAMEGPTPSSAIFYGALSVHGGIYLLLRFAPWFAKSPWASGVLVLLGLVTALHASLIARVQADAKSQLAYATMTQLGWMCVELGLGFPRLAAVHLLAHAVFRAWQFLRAPGSLRALVGLAAQLNGRPTANALWLRWLPAPWQERLWFLALERFQLESTQEHWILRPLLRTGRVLDGIERRWDAALQPTSETAATPVSNRGGTA